MQVYDDFIINLVRKSYKPLLTCILFLYIRLFFSYQSFQLPTTSYPVNQQFISFQHQEIFEQKDDKYSIYLSFLLQSASTDHIKLYVLNCMDNKILRFILVDQAILYDVYANSFYFQDYKDQIVSISYEAHLRYLMFLMIFRVLLLKFHLNQQYYQELLMLKIVYDLINHLAFGRIKLDHQNLLHRWFFLNKQLNFCFLPFFFAFFHYNWQKLAILPIQNNTLPQSSAITKICNFIKIREVIIINQIKQKYLISTKMILFSYCL